MRDISAHGTTFPDNFAPGAARGRRNSVLDLRAALADAGGMAEIARIVSSAVRDPFSLIRELGGDPLIVCAEAGCDITLLASATATLPLSAFVALVQQGSVQLRAPHFGRLVGRRFDFANLGDVGEAALRAPTLGAALRLIERAFAVVQGESDLRLDVAAGEATLTYRILDSRIWPRDQDAELTLGVFISLVGSIAGPRWRPRTIFYEHGPNGADRVTSARPDCMIVYEAPANAFSFDACVLDLPMPQSDPARFQPMAQALRTVVHRLERYDGVEARVRRAVQRDLGRVPVDQTQVAQALGMSRRTLRRKLDEAGTGFARIVAECRDANARTLLAETRLEMPVIADRLGYSDVTAFERAFTRRAGQTPTAYRRELAAEAPLSHLRAPLVP